MVREYGYDSRAGLAGAILLAAVVLPWSRAVSTPERNINWTYGLGAWRSPLAPVTYVAMLFAAFVLLVFIPTHYLLAALYGPQP
jgi:hypothetical protein